MKGICINCGKDTDKEGIYPVCQPCEDAFTSHQDKKELQEMQEMFAKMLGTIEKDWK